jgi:hypothetical protein
MFCIINRSTERFSCMHRIAAIIFLIIISCNDSKTVPQRSSLKDSMVRDYLKKMETSSVFHDTLNSDYKILKAYINDDSAFFLRMKKSAEAWKEEQALETKKEKMLPDTCVHLKKLSALPVDKAYRFTHSESFCYYSQIITISKLKDSFWLDYVEFTSLQEGRAIEYEDGIKISAGCTLAKEFRKQLARKDWDSLERKVYEAEYYGMKPYYNNLTTDGSWWRLDAYRKENNYYYPSFYSVYRHSPANSKFCEIGLYMMKLSGAKKMCGDFF